jgi:predicted Zn finger-like uncharacterized protein
MRLICPNCGAQYEVDSGLIPPAGRDVQCSNCGHGWFQAPEGAAGDGDEFAEAGDLDGTGNGMDDGAGAPPAAQPGRRELDPEVAEVLRAEAAREAAARRAEAGGGLESQPDLGLEDADAEADARAASRSAAARARMSRLRGDDDAGPESPAEETPKDRRPARAKPRPEHARGEMLPDVEEINSTLRGQSDRGAHSVPDTPEEPRRGGGLGRGFVVVVLFAAIAAALYVFAPRIAAELPAAEPYLATYVEAVNELRATLNQWVARAAEEFRRLVG